MAHFPFIPFLIVAIPLCWAAIKITRSMGRVDAPVKTREVDGFVYYKGNFPLDDLKASKIVPYLGAISEGFF